MEREPTIQVTGFMRGKTIEFQDKSGHKSPEDQIFDLGSVSKVLGTTSLILKAIELNELNLDDLVQKFFPDFAHSEITIKDLLCHRSGMWEWWPLYFEARNRQEAISYIIKKPLRYAPHEARHYSDFGFILLGEIVTQVLGADLSNAFIEHIAEPLQLESTSYRTPIDLHRTVASSFGDRAEYNMVGTNSPYPVGKKPEDFSGWRKHILLGEINDGNAFHVLSSTSGHAGLFSTAEDLMKFSRALLDSFKGDGFFEKITLNEFIKFNLDPEQALGFARFNLTSENVSEIGFGHTGFPGTAFAIFPMRDAAIVMLTNRLLVDGNPINTRAKFESIATKFIS